MKHQISAFLAGALFAAGLVIAGMTQPAKVIGFLDVTGSWDPSLAFVMGGALVVYGVAFRLITKRSMPLLGGRFQIPSRTDITPRLLIGASLFGIGWSIAGFCPGPAIVGFGSGMSEAFVFMPGMVAGMVLFRWWDAWMARKAVKA